VTGPHAIPLSRPDIGDSEVRAVLDALRSGRLSMGRYVAEFEELVAHRAGRRCGIAVNSGTSGLHLCLLALGVGPGDEVITPAFSFVASANCALYVGAAPVFVDCDPGTLNMRPEAVEKAITEKTRAIVAVEVFGNPAGLDGLRALAARYEIPLVEDACEGLGGRLGRTPVGGFGRLAVFGFYPNKQITTGEGGMIVTDDDRLADLCRSLRNQGRPVTPEAVAGLGAWLSHERLGYNYRLDELSAALGCAQMRRLDELIEARQRVAGAYTRRLMSNTDLIVPTIAPDAFISWFVYVVRLSDRFSIEDRRAIIEGLRRHDVGACNYFPPIPLLPFFRQAFGFAPGDFPVAESVSQRTLALPFYPGLSSRDVDLVCQTLELMMARIAFARA
jgi:perosamine synthetase